MQQDFYRPASYTTFAAGLDAQGWPVAWNARVVCPSFGGLRDGVDRTGVEGIPEVYDIPNMRVDYHPPDVGIPVSFWRSVGYSQNTFFTESFIDEMAAAASKDPLEFRRRLLAKQPRLLGVLNLAAEKIGWNTPLPAGRFRGIGLSPNVGSFEAQVAEISVNQGKVQGSSCRVRRGLRLYRQSSDHRPPGPRRYRFRSDRSAEGRDYDRSRTRPAGQLQ